ncbi:RING-type domain-containing protein [Entamoeba marina]
MAENVDQLLGFIISESFTERLVLYLNEKESISSTLQTPNGTVLGTSLGRVLLFNNNTNEVVNEKQLYSKDEVIGIGYDSGMIYTAQTRGQIVKIHPDFKSLTSEEELKATEKITGFCMDRNGNRNKKMFCYSFQSGSTSPVVRIADKSGLFGANVNLVCKHCNRVVKMLWIGNVICVVAGNFKDGICKDAFIYLQDTSIKSKDFQDVFNFNNIQIAKGSECCILPCNDSRLVVVYGQLRINIDISPSVLTDGKKKFSQSTFQIVDKSISITSLAMMENRIIGFVNSSDGKNGMKILQSSSSNETNSIHKMERDQEPIAMHGYTMDGEKIIVISKRTIEVARMRKDMDTIQLLIERKRFGEILSRVSAAKEKFTDKGDIQFFWKSYILDLDSIKDEALVRLENHLKENILDQSDVVAIIQESETKEETKKFIDFFTKYCVKYYQKLKFGYDALLYSKSNITMNESSFIITEDLFKSFTIKQHIDSYHTGTVASLSEYQTIINREIDKYNEVLLFPGMPSSIQRDIGKATTSSEEFAMDKTISDFQSFVIQFDLNNGLYTVACDFALKTQNPSTLLYVLKTIEKNLSDKLKELVPIFGNDFDAVKMCIPTQESFNNMILEFQIYQRLFRLFEKVMSQGYRGNIIESLSHHIDDNKNGPQLLYASATGRIADLGSYAVLFFNDLINKFYDENKGKIRYIDNEVAVDVIMNIVDIIDKKNSTELVRKVFSDVIQNKKVGEVVVPLILRRSSYKVQLFDEIPNEYKIGDISKSICDMICSQKFTNQTLTEVLKLAKEESRRKLSKASDKRGITFSAATVCSKCDKPATGALKVFYCGHVYHEGCHKENTCVQCTRVGMK